MICNIIGAFFWFIWWLGSNNIEYVRLINFYFKYKYLTTHSHQASFQILSHSYDLDGYYVHVPIYTSPYKFLYVLFRSLLV